MKTPVRHQDSALKPRAHPAATPRPSRLRSASTRPSSPCAATSRPSPSFPRRGPRAGDGALPCGPFLPREHDGLEAALALLGQAPHRRRARLRPPAVHHRRPPRICRRRPIARPVHRSSCATWRSSGPPRFNERDGAIWRSWYAYLPWEDWRRGKPHCLTQDIEPQLGRGPRPSRLRRASGAPAARPGPAAAPACSASMVQPGTRRRFWSATSCCARRACSAAGVAAGSRIRVVARQAAAPAERRCWATTHGCSPAPSASCAAASSGSPPCSS